MLVLGEPDVQAWLVMAPREPRVGPERTANVSSQDSRSEAERVTTTGVSSSVATALSSAVGRSLTGLMVMETVASSKAVSPSVPRWEEEGGRVELGGGG